MHTRTGRRLVLTGGPGAGKTAVLEMLRHLMCQHMVMVPEAAGILFGGGFPREKAPPFRAAAQRAIYHIQIELEGLADLDHPALVLCDRGVVDGAAYWPGPDDYWAGVGTTREEALARYDTVVHMRTPGGVNGYGHQNPLRTETPEEAAIIDQRIFDAWEGHPHRIVVDAAADFPTKARRAVEIVLAEMPSCCPRKHVG